MEHWPMPQILNSDVNTFLLECQNFVKKALNHFYDVNNVY